VEVVTSVQTNNGDSGRRTMASGMGRFSITTNRGGGAHSFHFTYGPRSGWLGALAAIPIAILGVFSVVVVLALVFVAVAVEIGARWFRFRAPRAPRDAAVHRFESEEIGARLKGPTGSPQ